NTLAGENISANTALANAQLAAQTSLTNQQAQDATSIANTTAGNATSMHNTATTTAENKAVAQLNATNSANIQASSNVAAAANTYQNALLNIENMNMGAQSKYAAESAAYNAYVQQVQTLSAASGVPDVSNLLQFNMVDPATGVVDPTESSGLITLSNGNSGNAPART
ncbi:MAG: hypothetical protein ACHP7O_01020, partial [Burkholderiales bacterium]